MLGSLKKLWRVFFAAGALVITLASPLWPGSLQCEGHEVSVEFQDREFAELACEVVDEAEELFAKCGELGFPDRLNIRIVPELPQDCVAMYHCGKSAIDVLAPPFMTAKRDPEGAFAFLSLREYFRSVLVHELAHAATDAVECPIQSCVASDEYVAYALQVMSMSRAAQHEFAARSGFERRVSRDELSQIILLMAPNLFAQKVWAHLSQRDDQCGFIGQLADRTVVLDRERF
ncbi:MAG: hypothetical protein ACR2OY_07135 [Boseongicola sp.]